MALTGHGLEPDRLPVTPSISAAEALERLRQGNQRFVSGARQETVGSGSLEALVAAQHPFAAVLGCADARVPVEIVFDQAPGDLFVVRVAGNVAGPSQIGSLEYAVERLGTRLIVVLAHTSCGAVAAAVAEAQRPTATGSPHLRTIVDRIRASIEPLLVAASDLDADELHRRAVRANARSTAARLTRESDVVRRVIGEDDFRVVVAEYSLESGRVEFLGDA